MICAADRADADLYDGRALDYGYAFAEAVSAPVVVELTGFSAAFGAEERARVWGGCEGGHCFITRGFVGVWIRGCMDSGNYYSPFIVSTISLKLSSPASTFSIISFASISGSGKLSRSARLLSFTQKISRFVLSLETISS